MLPKDKYTIFDKKERKYRKGIHSMFFTCVLFQSQCFGSWFKELLLAGHRYSSTLLMICCRTSQMDSTEPTFESARFLMECFGFGTRYRQLHETTTATPPGIYHFLYNTEIVDRWTSPRCEWPRSSSSRRMQEGQPELLGTWDDIFYYRLRTKRQFNRLNDQLCDS